MKTAIVHEWLTGIGGSENVVEAICELYPSPIYTLVKNQAKLKGTAFEDARILTSFVQKLPWSKTKYSLYLPLFPMAIEQFDLSGYDVVISSSHAVAKGVLTGTDQVHICYCHTPIRYAWDLYHQYLREAGLVRGIKSVLARMILHYIRTWDATTAFRVDHFIANSRYIAARIHKIYRRKAQVIYPPVNTETFTLCSQKEDYYVAASRLVPYKRMDLIVEAFSRMPDKKLVVIGDGPELKKVKARAGQNVKLLGYQSHSTLKEYLQKAKALIFAAIEDFGILPVEAQSCGTPVIAYKKGGAKETVLAGDTGVFFEEQTIASLTDAVSDFERQQFDPYLIRKNAERFSKQRFQKEFREFVTQVVSQENTNGTDIEKMGKDPLKNAVEPGE